MLDINLLRKNTKEIKKLMKGRVTDQAIIDVISAYEQYIPKKKILEDLLAKRNNMKVHGVPSKEERTHMNELKEKIKNAELIAENSLKLYLEKAYLLPNIPHVDVPAGTTGNHNKTIKKVGKQKELVFKPLSYLSLKDAEDMFALEQAGKTSGTRFAFMKNKAAILEFSLLHYAFSKLLQKGFEPVFPPTMIKKDVMKGMGYLDQAGDREVFHLRDDELVLVGTSEQSIGSLHVNKTFQELDLPKRYVAFSSCYRREAGSYGKDTKGVLRMHQFEKIEMFSFATPEQSEKEHALLLSIQEEFLQDLDLHYQVVELCSGDLGNPSSRTFDIECWMPGQAKKGEYRETHSTSNCTDFQSRRLNIRFENTKKKQKEFVHTINGTAFAIPRMIIALMEQYQNSSGSFDFPKALLGYAPKGFV